MDTHINASFGHAKAISCPPDSDLYAMFVYATAAVNLYGTISIDELCDIVTVIRKCKIGRIRRMSSKRGLVKTRSVAQKIGLILYICQERLILITYCYT